MSYVYSWTYSFLGSRKFHRKHSRCKHLCHRQLCRTIVSMPDSFAARQSSLKQFRCKQFHRKKRNCFSFNNGLEANQPSTKGRPNPIGQFPYILTTTMTTGSPDY